MNDLLPDPAPVLELLVGFRRSKTMFAAVELGVFDALSAGSKPLDALAQELKARPDALERLLDACVGLGLLSKTHGAYANTPATTTYLCKQSDRRVLGYVHFSNHVMWNLWSHLEDAVREGTNRWKQAYGWDAPIFANFFHTEEALREFLLGMHGYGLISSPQVVEAFDLSPYHVLADLGGATGHLAVAACRRYGAMRAVVQDLPEALPLARELVSQTEVHDRVGFSAGDFFRDPLPAADVYALGRILHDWAEPKILTLLGRIHEALASGGAVLIAEKLLNEDKTGPTWAQMQNLNMLCCTEGKERTLEEYQALLQSVGFDQVQVRRLPGPLDAVLARKP